MDGDVRLVMDRIMVQVKEGDGSKPTSAVNHVTRMKNLLGMNSGLDAILALIVREWCASLLSNNVPLDVVENLAKLGNEEAHMLLRWKRVLVQWGAGRQTVLTSVSQQTVDSVSPGG
jgi:hypothetical protein